MVRPEFETMTTKQLCQWYLETVGYDPIAEGWEESEILSLCVEMFDEIVAAQERIR